MFLNWKIKKLEIHNFILKFNTLCYGTILIIKTAEVERLQDEFDYYMSRMTLE